MKKSPAKMIILARGAFWSFMSVVFLLLLTVKRLFRSVIEPGSEPDPLQLSFQEMNLLLEELWFVYMPMLLLISLLYVGLGLKYANMKSSRRVAHLFLSVLSFIWALLYGLSLLNIQSLMLETMGEAPEAFKAIFAAMGYGMIPFIFVIISGPDIFIYRLLKKEE